MTRDKSCFSIASQYGYYISSFRKDLIYLSGAADGYICIASLSADSI